MNNLRVAYKSKNIKKQHPFQDVVDQMRREIEETWRKNSEKKFKVDLSHLKGKPSSNNSA